MWIVENDPECLYLTFSVDEEVFGMVSDIQLNLNMTPRLYRTAIEDPACDRYKV